MHIEEGHDERDFVHIDLTPQGRQFHCEREGTGVQAQNGKKQTQSQWRSGASGCSSATCLTECSPWKLYWRTQRLSHWSDMRLMRLVF